MGRTVLLLSLVVGLVWLTTPSGAEQGVVGLYAEWGTDLLLLVVLGAGLVWGIRALLPAPSLQASPEAGQLPSPALGELEALRREERQAREL